MRHLSRLALLLLLTVALYGGLYLAAVINRDLQLVVFVPALDQPEFHQHGRPTISPMGVALYAVMLFAHALVAAYVVLGWRGLREERSWMMAALLVFALNAAYVCIVDPYLLMTALPPDAWAAYASGVQRFAPPLDQIYDHWAFARYAPYLIALQAFLAYGVLAVWARRQARGGDRLTAPAVH